MDANSLLVLLVRPQMHAYALYLVRRYRDLVERDEVISAVDLALLRAVNRFDPRRGCFEAYAAIWVRREVNQLVRAELEWRRRYIPEDEHEPANVETPLDEVERAQMLQLSSGDSHALWRAHVGRGLSVRELAINYALSPRQVMRRIASSQRRLSRLHGLGPVPLRRPRRSRRR